MNCPLAGKANYSNSINLAKFL